MPRVFAYLGQGVIYGVIAVLLGYFAMQPSYQRFSPDKAQLLVSFSHVGERKVPCRKPSAEELAKMAPNMRRKEICERERVPVLVEITLSDETIYREQLEPTGTSRDGASLAYQRFVVEPGRHRLVARLRDSARESGFDYETVDEIELAPGENFVIDFRDEFGGFLLGTHRKRAGRDAS